jgi:HK97 family phage prohead protease
VEERLRQTRPVARRPPDIPALGVGERHHRLPVDSRQLGATGRVGGDQAIDDRGSDGARGEPPLVETRWHQAPEIGVGSAGQVGGVDAPDRWLRRRVRPVEQEDLGGFVEQVHPKAFDPSKGYGWPDVVARHNHRELVGTVKAGTLELRVDRQGLAYEVELPASPGGDDLLELVRRGDVDQSSFAFIVRADQWDVSEQGYPMRTLTDVQLVDVAPVDSAAYPETTAGLRGLARRFDMPLDEIHQGYLFEWRPGSGPASLELRCLARAALVRPPVAASDLGGRGLQRGGQALGATAGRGGRARG